ncbi:unnamed protein product [Diamesa serratosioi]
MIYSKYPSMAMPLTSCGGTLTEQRGIIQTPNFPNPFRVPISCTWIIDSSAFMDTPNASIIVYLTQQYVLSGLIFKEYVYYSDDYKVPSQTQDEYSIKEENVTQTSLVRSSSPFLEIKFQLDSLYGTHLRVMDHLLDVYGFNITYEIATLKPYQCNPMRCSFLGDCFATHNYSSYYCKCYGGYSGVDCSIGPLCNNSRNCENGGTCKHVGDSSIECLCHSGFRGINCEIHEYEDELNECNLSKSSVKNESDNRSYECFNHCMADLNNDELCRCNQNNELTRNRSRFEVSLRLGNASLFNLNDNGEQKINSQFAMLLDKHISRYLRNANISKINDLEIFSKTMSANDLTFHFFGAKSDSLRVREAINKMVEKGRIGNFSLISTHYALHQEPGLILQTLESTPKSPLREKSDLVIACTAQGSSRLSFKWFKNGMILNTSRSMRKVSSIELPMDSMERFVSLLSINNTDRIDGGIYTCQVIDWGLQVCKSIKIDILEAPQIKLDPPSVTLFRGASIRIRCLATQMNHVHDRLGYSWTKNHALFHSDPDIEMWEDLYPDGSILTIENIQKSATYSCAVSNPLAPVSSHVQVTVVDQETIIMCPENASHGIKWPASSSGPPVLSDCPLNYNGQAQRFCEQRDYRKSEWLIPDFSDCINQDLIHISNEFKELTYGLQKTNASTLLRSCLEYAMNHYTNFLPGEGGFLLTLLQEIYEFSQLMDVDLEKEISSDFTLKVIDMILLNETSLNKQPQVKQLQDLVQLVALKRDSNAMVLPVSAVSNPLTTTSISSSAASTSPTKQLKSLQIYKRVVKSVPFTFQIYGDQLFSDQLYMEIDISSVVIDAISNGTVTVSIISYRNLTYFLPKMYFSRSSSGTDINYIPASKVISSWLIYSNHTNEGIKLHLPLNAAHVEIIFQHENSPSNEWVPLCGYDSKATYEPSWRTDLCITENLMENITRCICPMSGTFVVLLVKKSYNISMTRTSSVSMFIIISCGCCFLQSTIAFVILLPNIYIRRCYISILKMQFCVSISITMAFLILGLLKYLPQEWYGLLSSSLAAVLLLSSSTLVAIVLIIQSELEMQTSALFTTTSSMQLQPQSLTTPTAVTAAAHSKALSSMKKMSIKTTTTITTTATTPSSESSTTGTSTDDSNSGSSTIKQQKQRKFHPSKQKTTIKFANLATSNNGVKSAIGLSWLLPLLCAMCVPLIHNIIGHSPIEWWLEVPSFDFVIFAVTEALLVCLFMMLFVTLMKNLIYLSRKYEKMNIILKKRIGLLNRIAVLFVINLLSHMFYLIYLNTNQSIFCYLFSITSILLGLMIIFCFIIKVESYSGAETTSSSSNKSSMKNSIDDFCTTTITNPLNFYHSQDMEKDNKSLPMKVFSTTLNYPNDTKVAIATTALHQSSTQCRMMAHSDEIIDLTSAATTPPSVSVNSKARSYELQKINNSMINMYDDANGKAKISSFGEIGVVVAPGWTTEPHKNSKWPIEKSVVNSLDILQGISKDSIIGIRDNNLENKKHDSTIVSPPIIILTNSDGKRTCDNLVVDVKISDPDGMLNLISNDLDYLLNRTQEVPPTQQQQSSNQTSTATIITTSSDVHYHNLPPPPPPPAGFGQTTQKSTLLQHDVILEESEHELDS